MTKKEEFEKTAKEIVNNYNSCPDDIEEHDSFKTSEGFTEWWHNPKCLEHQIASALQKAVEQNTEDIAKIVEGWHIKKGGYCELAHVIRERQKGKL